MKLQITDIEFDLSTDDDSIPEHIHEQVQQELRDEYIGTNWEADEEDELVDLISDETGWCVNSIEYKEIK